MSLSVDASNRLLDVLRSEHLSIQLHVGPPGDGTQLVARERRRLRIRFKPPADGAMKSTVTLTWLSVAADERWTHFSLWDMDRMHVGNGEIDRPEAVRAGDDVDLDSVTVRVVAAAASS